MLDKTGTVTTGQMTLADVLTVPGTDRDELLWYAASVEQASEHAVAAAIAAAPLPSLAPVDGFVALPGLGARGEVARPLVTICRQVLFGDLGVPSAVAGWCADAEQAGRTAVLVAWDGAVRGAIAVIDTVKPWAAAAVAALRDLGLRPVLLTGDNEATARSVAAAAGIDEVISGALPADKARVIADLAAAGRSVAMVGDGVGMTVRRLPPPSSASRSAPAPTSRSAPPT